MKEEIRKIKLRTGEKYIRDLWNKKYKYIQT